MKYLFCFILFFSSYSFGAAQISGNGIITELHVSSSSYAVRVKFSQSIKGQGCGGEDFYVAELSDSKASDRYFAALLAAYASQRTVSFWVSGCTTGSYWGATRPKISDIYMSQ